MVFPPELLDALERLSSAPWAGGVYRHVFGENSPVAENISGARWNPPGTAAIYVTFASDTAVAEGDHAVAVQPLRTQVARWIYPLEVGLSHVVDLSDRNLLIDLGITNHELASDDHAACQLVGGAVAWLGRDGLIVPSARHEGTNLVIFPTNLDPGSTLLIKGERESVRRTQ